MDWKNDSSKLKSNATQNPETAKPSINLSANKIIMALMTNKNNPKVIIVIGKVNIISNGLTKIRKRPNTIATKMADE